MSMVLRDIPKLIDEPTSGLDPESAQNVNQMIHNLARKEGITVFLCTASAQVCTENLYTLRTD